jgi:hypothetical protein
LILNAEYQLLNKFDRFVQKMSESPKVNHLICSTSALNIVAATNKWIYILALYTSRLLPAITVQSPFASGGYLVCPIANFLKVGVRVITRTKD